MGDDYFGTAFSSSTNADPNLGFMHKLLAANCILLPHNMYWHPLEVKSSGTAEVMLVLLGCSGQAVALELLLLP